MPRPPSSPLFPYATLFRSLAAGSCSADVVAVEARKHAAAAGPAEAGTAWQALERPRRSRAAVITLPRRPAPALPPDRRPAPSVRSEEHTSELQSRFELVCR